jgi:putative transposase
VRTWAGFVYVAFVVDVFAQRIVSWHAMTTKPAELVLIPLRMAAWSRGQQGHPITRGDLIAHSDAGSIHGAEVYRAPRPGGHRRVDRDRWRRLRQQPDGDDHRPVQDRGHPPGPFHTGPLKHLGDVEFTTMAWVDRFNHRRLHSSLGMLTPVEAEAAHYAATTALHPEPQPV